MTKSSNSINIKKKKRARLLIKTQSLTHRDTHNLFQERDTGLFADRFGWKGLFVLVSWPFCSSFDKVSERRKCNAGTELSVPSLKLKQYSYYHGRGTAVLSKSGNADGSATAATPATTTAQQDSHHIDYRISWCGKNDPLEPYTVTGKAAR